MDAIGGLRMLIIGAAADEPRKSELNSYLPRKAGRHSRNEASGFAVDGLTGGEEWRVYIRHKPRLSK